MATAKKPGGQQAAVAKANQGTWIVWVVVGVAVLCCVGIGVVNRSGGGDDVLPPTSQERGDTVPILQRSSASQGICYGWVLRDFYEYTDLSVGSNLGEGVAVEENAACPRWVQVVAQVAYTSESSESNDFARITVEASDDVSATAQLRMESGLERLGLTEDAFVDEPGWAVTRAAVSLPLLAAEAGLVEPAATPAAATADAPPLPDAGSDLWRDRWGYLLAAVGLLLFTALLFAAGFWQRGRQRREEAQRQAQAGAGMRDFRVARQAAARDPRRTPEGR
ncbi:hypothetical protein [Micromonospora sp. NBC_01740]|uniref:hypothetical protein n=1 Tax=unclassified Micromonospora TaxID=2617518 RepID=UPI002E10BAC4|nr:hypothetical protein OG989_07875 [Micromonospora sp. NBC_01740]